MLTAIPTRRARLGSVYVPDSPSDLCRMLRLDPDADQIDLMERMARTRGHFDAFQRDPTSGEIDGSALRAACMVLLWRVLRVPGSRGIVLGPPAGDGMAAGELAHLAIAFILEVCKTRDAVLSSISAVSAWHCVRFGSEEGWEVRFVHNVPSIVAESARRSLTALVLDAGNAESSLVDAQRELEGLAREPRGLVIRLW